MPSPPHEHAGVCDAAGWAREGSGPNCTFVGHRLWHWHNATEHIVVGSCARNVRAPLEHGSRVWIEGVLEQSGGGALIFEDEQRGDRDGTRRYLRAWAASDPRLRLILAQPLLYPRWSRTQRLALCRNMLAREAVRALPERGALISVDLDCTPSPPAAILGIARQLSAHRAGAGGPPSHGVRRPAWARWDVATVNSHRTSYPDRRAPRQFSPRRLSTAHTTHCLRHSPLQDTLPRYCRAAPTQVGAAQRVPRVGLRLLVRPDGAAARHLPPVQHLHPPGRASIRGQMRPRPAPV